MATGRPLQPQIAGDGAVGVDPQSLTLWNWQRWQGTNAGVNAERATVFSQVDPLDVVNPMSWTDYTYFKTNDGTQSNMARAGSPWVQNILDFGDQGSYPELPAAANYVLKVEAKIAAIADSSSFPVVGGTCRNTLSIDSKRIAIFDNLERDRGWISAFHPQPPATIVDLTAFIEEDAGRHVGFLTVADVDLWLDRLRWIITARIEEETTINAIYAGRPEICITHVIPGNRPDTQKQFWFRVTKKEPPSGGTDGDTGTSPGGPGDPGFTLGDVEFLDTWATSAEDTTHKDWYALRTDEIGLDETVERWAQVTLRDQAGEPSAGDDPETDTPNAYTFWGPPAKFTLLPGPARDMLHGQLSIVQLLEPEFLIWRDNTKWEIEPVVGGFSRPQIYRCPLLRSEVRIPQWYVIDIEIDGKRQGLTSVGSMRECHETPNSFHMSDRGMQELAYEDHTQGYFYVHLADGRNPSASMTMGVGLVAVLPIASEPIMAGPGNSIPYLPLLANPPNFTQELADFESGRLATVSGSITLDNVQDAIDDVTGRRDPILYRLVQLEDPNEGGRPNLLMNRRPATSRLMTPGMHWEDTPIIFKGSVEWEPESILTPGATNLRLLSFDDELKRARIADKKTSKEQYPHILARHDGKPIREAIGSRGGPENAGFIGLELLMVDQGQVAPDREAKFLVGKGFDRVLRVAIDDAIEPEANWSFDRSNGLVTMFFTGITDGEKQIELDYLRSARVTADVNGKRLRNYEGVLSDECNAGALLVELLGRVYHQDEYDKAAFFALDDPTGLGEQLLLRPLWAAETSILEAIRVICASRQIYLARGFDRKLRPVSAFPVNTDPNTLWLRGDDLVEEPAFQATVDNVADRITCQVVGYDTIDSIDYREVSSESSIPGPRYGLTGEKSFTTYISELGDGNAFLARPGLFNHPLLQMTCRIARRALFAYPGGTVVFLDELKPQAGQQPGLMNRYLWQIRAISKHPDMTQELKLRRTGLLPWEVQIGQ